MSFEHNITRTNSDLDTEGQLTNLYHTGARKLEEGYWWQKLKNMPFNPFRHVLYENEYGKEFGTEEETNIERQTRHARSLHFGFSQKIKDTFLAFNGDTFYVFPFSTFNSEQNNQSEKESLLSNSDELASNLKQEHPAYFKLSTRPGLFDYATLGAFRIIHALASFFGDIAYPQRRVKEDVKVKIKSNKSSLWGKVFHYALRTLAFIPYASFELAHFIGNGLLRPVVSGVATFAFLLAVATAEIISDVVAFFIKRDLKNAATEQYKNNRESIDEWVEDTHKITMKKLRDELGNVSLSNVIVATPKYYGTITLELPPSNRQVTLFFLDTKAYNKAREQLALINPEARKEFALQERANVEEERPSI